MAGTYIRTAAHREHLSKLYSGEGNPMFGKHPSNETRKKLSLRHKGKPLSLKNRIGISKALMGHKVSEATKKKLALFHTGTHLSEETRRKMSITRKGRKPSESTRLKMSQIMKGRKCALGCKRSLETRKKLSMALKGEKHPNWQGGRSSENNRIRQSFEYNLWRDAVFKRDDFTCQMCGQRGQRLEADHILSFAKYPEHRFNIQNGRTLCGSCHKTVHRKNKGEHK